MRDDTKETIVQLVMLAAAIAVSMLTKRSIRLP